VKKSGKYGGFYVYGNYFYGACGARAGRGAGFAGEVVGEFEEAGEDEEGDVIDERDGIPYIKEGVSYGGELDSKVKRLVCAVLSRG